MQSCLFMGGNGGVLNPPSVNRLQTAIRSLRSLQNIFSQLSCSFYAAFRSDRSNRKACAEHRLFYLVETEGLEPATSRM